ncbi:MAG: hypothetical protein F4X58_06585 [Chloroflexi bacterium]|nr:hypothetical protein [Chloroflexota bacterium]MYC01570.1 hypothetical protein [Chloroflexota bacterium]
MSFVDNGYFAHEPLIVTAPDEEGIRTVIEGNRRLATLTILLGLDAAPDDAGFAMALPSSPTELESLKLVPCYEVEDQALVHRFLGFRHIGGIKTWSAEAKARYLLREVDRVHKDQPEDDAFRIVGRLVGSNAQGVRNPYIAMKILIYAREQFGIDVSFVQGRRFGVLNRAMNSPDLRRYIGFGDARTFDEIQNAVEGLDRDNLSEVLRDMSPTPDGGRAVLSDSRNVTIYSQVLASSQAHKILREYNNLDLARRVVEQASIPDRIAQIGQSVEALNREVERQGAPSEATDPARELASLARALLALIEASQ